MGNVKLQIPCLLALVLALVSLPSNANNYPDPRGLWLTSNKTAAVRVESCEEGLCGYISWLDSSIPQVDANKGQPLCNMRVLWGLRQSEEDPKTWVDGRVYKADEGDFYNAHIELKNERAMYLHGYVGIPLFGRSYSFTRTSHAVYPPCQVHIQQSANRK